MKKPFMTYYESMAKMAVIANKKTNFLAHLLHRMEFDTEKKILYVDVSPMIKRDILKAIGAESKNPLILASQYLSELQKADLIKSMGGGRYTVDPMSFGYAKYVPKIYARKQLRFIKWIFSMLMVKNTPKHGWLIAMARSINYEQVKPTLP